MLKKISKIAGSKELNKSAQKNIQGGFILDYAASCGPGMDGLRCVTNLPHCPYGTCGGSVCIPTAVS